MKSEVEKVDKSEKKSEGRYPLYYKRKMVGEALS